jgi:hypothetical protein
MMTNLRFGIEGRMNLSLRLLPGASHQLGSSWSPAREQQCEGSGPDVKMTQKCA